jgi:hypothetical protein
MVIRQFPPEWIVKDPLIFLHTHAMPIGSVRIDRSQQTGRSRVYKRALGKEKFRIGQKQAARGSSPSPRSASIASRTCLGGVRGVCRVYKVALAGRTMHLGSFISFWLGRRTAQPKGNIEIVGDEGGGEQRGFGVSGPCLSPPHRLAEGLAA